MSQRKSTGKHKPARTKTGGKNAGKTDRKKVVVKKKETVTTTTTQGPKASKVTAVPATPPASPPQPPAKPAATAAAPAPATPVPPVNQPVAPANGRPVTHETIVLRWALGLLVLIAALTYYLLACHHVISSPQPNGQPGYVASTDTNNDNGLVVSTFTNLWNGKQVVEKFGDHWQITGGTNAFIGIQNNVMPPPVINYTNITIGAPQQAPPPPPQPSPSNYQPAPPSNDGPPPGARPLGPVSQVTYVQPPPRVVAMGEDIYPVYSIGLYQDTRPRTTVIREPVCYRNYCPQPQPYCPPRPVGSCVNGNTGSNHHGRR